MTQGSDILWKLEENEIGLTLGSLGTMMKNYNMLTYFGMCIANFFIFVLLGLYLSYVLPTEFGIRKHPLFCLMPSFWKKSKKLKTKSHNSDYKYSKLNERQYEDNAGDLEALEMNENSFNEPVPPHFKNKDKLQLRNLVKVYDNGLKAVDNLSLSMYKDQIFALLGPNGAGKTSTISMITGLYEATNGTAEVFGINIFEEMDQIRETLGVCPQFNVLFDQLTPEEHFDIFCEFKGVPRNERSQQIKSMLEDVDLDKQSTLLSKNLSGGQKRKVNVGIALLGGSKIVLLDEPSSGLDPTARRRLWDMLKRHKQDRIIILTTHFMEEADILGDRIAIMTKGKSS